MKTELRISDSHPWLRTGTAALFLTLLILILIRLVWVQLRTFQVFPEPSMTATARLMDAVHSNRCAQVILKSTRGLGEMGALPQPGVWPRSPSALISPDWVGNRLLLRSLCVEGVFDSNLMMRLNETFFLLSALMIGFLSRIVTGRWLVGLIAVVSLVSRGRVLGELGVIGVTYLLMLCFSCWALCILWFHMTRARVVLLVGCGVISVAAAVDWRFAGLHMIFPVSIFLTFLASIRRSQAIDASAMPPTVTDVPPSAELPLVGMLTPLPFAKLERIARNRQRTCADIGLYGFFAILGLGAIYQIWQVSCVGYAGCSLEALRVSGRISLFAFGDWRQSLWLLFQEWDLHLIWSMVGLLFLGVAGKRALGSRYIEGALTVLIGCLVIGGMRLWYFPLELSLTRAAEMHRLQHVLIWGEPVVLSFAIIAIYRIIELLNIWLRPKGIS